MCLTILSKWALKGLKELTSVDEIGTADSLATAGTVNVYFRKYKTIILYNAEKKIEFPHRVKH